MSEKYENPEFDVLPLGVGEGENISSPGESIEDPTVPVDQFTRIPMMKE